MYKKAIYNWKVSLGSLDNLDPRRFHPLPDCSPPSASSPPWKDDLKCRLCIIFLDGSERPSTVLVHERVWTLEEWDWNHSPFPEEREIVFGTHDVIPYQSVTHVECDSFSDRQRRRVSSPLPPPHPTDGELAEHVFFCNKGPIK